MDPERGSSCRQLDETELLVGMVRAQLAEAVDHEQDLRAAGRWPRRVGREQGGRTLGCDDVQLVEHPEHRGWVVAARDGADVGELHQRSEGTALVDGVDVEGTRVVHRCQRADQGMQEGRPP